MPLIFLKIPKKGDYMQVEPLLQKNLLVPGEPLLQRWLILSSNWRNFGISLITLYPNRNRNTDMCLLFDGVEF